MLYVKEADERLAKKQRLMLRSMDPDLELYSLEAQMLSLGIDDYSINEDDSFNIEGDLRIKNKDWDKIPIKINKVSGNLSIVDNDKLVSLEGMLNNGWSSSVGGYVNIVRNAKLESLDGLPSSVGNYLIIAGNPNLKSLKGLPSSVGNYLNIVDNGRKFTEEEIRAVCDVKDGIYL